MEVPGRHQDDEKPCWKDTNKYIGKDRELLESSRGVFLESSKYRFFLEIHNAISLAIRRSAPKLR